MAQARAYSFDSSCNIPSLCKVFAALFWDMANHNEMAIPETTFQVYDEF